MQKCWNDLDARLIERGYKMKAELRKDILEKINDSIGLMERGYAYDTSILQGDGVRQYIPLTYTELLELKKMLRG